MSQRRNISNFIKICWQTCPTLAPQRNIICITGQESNLPLFLKGDTGFLSLDCLWGEETLALIPWNVSQPVTCLAVALQTFLHKAVNSLCSEVMEKWQTHGELSPSILQVYQSQFCHKNRSHSKYLE